MMESLEQLCVFENGILIQVVLIDYCGCLVWFVDSFEDVECVEDIIWCEGELV